jgi:sugar (pentulose or hexulose) kinase
MAPKYVLGVDGGTGGIRAGLFEIATGAPVGFADTPYDTTHPEPGYAEQNPIDWWNGMGASVRRVLAETGVAPEDVAGLCCDTTCCSVVALDDAGDALMPCILWMDMRAAEQTEQVRRHFSRNARRSETSRGGRAPRVLRDTPTHAPSDDPLPRLPALLVRASRAGPGHGRPRAARVRRRRASASTRITST